MTYTKVKVAPKLSTNYRPAKNGKVTETQRIKAEENVTWDEEFDVKVNPQRVPLPPYPDQFPFPAPPSPIPQPVPFDPTKRDDLEIEENQKLTPQQWLEKYGPTGLATKTIRVSGKKQNTLTAEQVKQIESSKEWKWANNPTTTMNDLSARQYLRHQAEHKAVTGESLSTCAYNSNGDLIPLPGQFFRVMKSTPNYFVCHEYGRTYLCTDDGTMKHLCSKFEKSEIPGSNDIRYLSIGRLMDILKKQPSLDDLALAGYKTIPFTQAELEQWGSLGLENAIPLFQ